MTAIDVRPHSSSTVASPPIVLAITGASGAVYAMRLLQALLIKQRSIHLCLSDSGVAVVRQELGVAVELDGKNLFAAMQAADELLGVQDVPKRDSRLDATGEQVWTTTAARAAAEDSGLLQVFHYRDYFTPMASGSFLTAGMIICPCSGSTLSGVARAASQNLIQRAAEVHLKEHRKLILVPRETPLSVLQLENMQRLAAAGAVILPASPGWYHGVNGLVDLVDFIVARILDQLGIDNAAIHRWQ